MNARDAFRAHRGFGYCAFWNSSQLPTYNNNGRWLVTGRSHRLGNERTVVEGPVLVDYARPWGTWS